MYLYSDGKFLKEEQVCLSPLDRSYLYGEGIFETLKAQEGRVLFFKEHWERLFKGSQSLGFKINFSEQDLHDILIDLLKKNNFLVARLRVTLSRQNQSWEDPSPKDHLNLLAVASPLTEKEAKEELFPVEAILLREIRFLSDALSHVKSTSRLRYLWAYAQAKAAHCNEALLLDTEGYLLEGSRSNLFYWNGKAWQTPSLGTGALPGVTRQVIIEIFKEAKIPFEEVRAFPEALKNAKEAFLTGSVRGISALTKVDGQAIGEAQVGEETQKVFKLWQTRVGQELAD
ncbi:MAG: aminotransferase class IV [Deltaproteobacteria bacterium]|nr:aminotransferase class IV [Deltaproteobacteria bacterium]